MKELSKDPGLKLLKMQEKETILNNSINISQIVFFLIGLN